MGLFETNDYRELLCCPACRADVDYSRNALTCVKCQAVYPVENGIPHMTPNLTEDLKLSIEKWDELYRQQIQDGSFKRLYDEYVNIHYADTYKQLNEAKPLTRETRYLEIGCGPFFLGQEIANKCGMIIGVDFCPSALTIARNMLDSRGIKNYLLIQGSVLRLPLKDGVIDVAYGGGVIEHFENTQECVDELYRILRRDGISFNTVPYLNIGSLTYRQVWGNIPNAPVLKQLAEFIHIKILKSKHMKFGYEMSFLGSTLEKTHKNSGFRNIVIDKFKVHLAFDYLPSALRSPSAWLAENSRLFWPMIKVIGEK